MDRSMLLGLMESVRNDQHHGLSPDDRMAVYQAIDNTPRGRHKVIYLTLIRTMGLVAAGEREDGVVHCCAIGWHGWQQ